ncbi:MAG: GYF domain-containing protein [Rubripirellula sp.]
MGIRFACHACDKRLNIKQDLAGRRGICPACAARFRIPLSDAEHSTPVDLPVATTTAPVGQVVSPVQQIEASKPVVSDPQPSAVPSPQVATDSEPAAEPENVPKQESASSVNVLEVDPQATWYVRPPSGGQYGPASSIVLKQWIGEGRVAANALLWRDGWPHWRDAKEVLPELASQLPQAETSQRPSAIATPQAESDGSVQAPDRPETLVAKDFAASTPDPNAYQGESGLGADKRARSMRRVMLIGVLSALAVTLVGALILIVNRQ